MWLDLSTDKESKSALYFQHWKHFGRDQISVLWQQHECVYMCHVDCIGTFLWLHVAVELEFPICQGAGLFKFNSKMPNLTFILERQSFPGFLIEIHQSCCQNIFNCLQTSSKSQHFHYNFIVCFHDHSNIKSSKQDNLMKIFFQCKHYWLNIEGDVIQVCAHCEKIWP